MSDVYPLVAFIRARLDDVEYDVRFSPDWPKWNIPLSGLGKRMDSVLRGVEAKRRAADGYETAYRAVNLAVDRHLASGAQSDGDEVVTRLHIRDQWELAAKLAALPYADHPEYRTEWAP